MVGSEPDGAVLAPLLRRAGSVIESEIRGASMGDALPDGSRIRIDCRADEHYPPGAVIAFVTPAGLVGHRVVAVRRKGQTSPIFFTRGDATIVCDGPVLAEWVLGEVTEWSDGLAWRPVPAAPTEAMTRRLASGLILSLIRGASLASVGWSGRLSRLLLRIANRSRPVDEPSRTP